MVQLFDLRSLSIKRYIFQQILFPVSLQNQELIIKLRDLRMHSPQTLMTVNIVKE